MALYDDAISDPKTKRRLELALEQYRRMRIPLGQTEEEYLRKEAGDIEAGLEEIFSEDYIKRSEDPRAPSCLESFLMDYIKDCDDDVHFLVAGDKVIRRLSLQLESRDGELLPTLQNGSKIVRGMQEYYLDLFSILSPEEFDRTPNLEDRLNVKQFKTRFNRYISDFIAHSILTQIGLVGMPMISLFAEDDSSMVLCCINKP